METTQAVTQSERSQARYVEVTTVYFRVACNTCGYVDVHDQDEDGRTMAEVQASFDEYHACT